MGLTFECSKCGQKIIVQYLKPGEVAECKGCGSHQVVPENAPFTHERPATAPKGQAAQAIESPARPPLTQEEILRGSTAVKAARWMGTGLWYISILAALLCVWNWIDPNASCFLTSRYVSLPYHVSYEDGKMLGDTDIAVLGHSTTTFETTEGISVWAAITNAIWVTMFIVAVWQLRDVTRSIAAAKPFQQANVKRLRILGVLIMIWSPLIALWEFVHAGYYASFTDFTPTEYTGSEFHPHFEAIIAGVIILAIAQVFAVGAKLQREQDLTI